MGGQWDGVARSREGEKEKGQVVEVEDDKDEE